MKKLQNAVFFSLLLACHCSLLNASPWYTGPLLAPSGRTVPLGHLNFEMYGFDTTRTAVYGSDGKKINVPGSESLQANPVITYGLTDRIDAQLSVPFTKNHTLGRTGEHMGDVSVLLGFQVHKQKQNSKIPDFRITIQEVFPTGRFDGLNPIDKGVGVTGTGGYEEVLGLDFQELTQFSDVHYLRTRFALAFVYAHPHDISGSSGFGGFDDTEGVGKQGNVFTADLAGEFSFTQNWVGVMELYYLRQQPGSFKGTLGHNGLGEEEDIAPVKVDFLSLSPAIEYNFSENYGIIGGVWFAVNGHNAPAFTSLVLAFNAFW